MVTILKKSIHAAPVRQQRIMLRQKYSITLNYKSGKQMHLADTPTTAPTTSTIQHVSAWFRTGESAKSPDLTLFTQKESCIGGIANIFCLYSRLPQHSPLSYADQQHTVQRLKDCDTHTNTMHTQIHTILWKVTQNLLRSYQVISASQTLS